MDAPWREPAVLRALAADWSRRLAGRPVARVTGGPGWLHLALGRRDEAPAHLLLLARPGAVLLADDEAPPPAALAAVFGREPRHPLHARLAGGRLAGVAAFAEDAALALGFAGPAGEAPLRLVHQLFGGRGNVLLVAPEGRLLWALHPSPHPALLAPPPDPSPVPAAEGAAASAACRAAALERLEPLLEAELTAALERGLRRREAAETRLRDNLARDLAAAARGDELRRAGEALAAALPAVPRGAARVTLPDPAGGPPLAIELDPALSPAANLDEYFRRARKADRGRDVIAQRLAAVEARLAGLAAARAELAAAAAAPSGRLAACLAWRDRHAPVAPAASRAGARGAREEPGPARPFRRYLIEGRWEVWLGRDNAENDELSLRAAAPQDIWLHAQGVPGSHAVLRTGGRPDQVPRRVLEKAAALAALHSRARGSALVPVVHTLRKHVRKPRKAPPGLVVCEREKTLFVPPGVPEGTTPA